MTTPPLSHPSKKRATKIGQILIENSVVSEDQLRIALQEQSHEYRPLGKLLVELGFVTEATLSDALSKSLETQSIDLQAVIPDPEALALVPYEIAKQHTILPLSYDPDNHVLTIATADPRNILAFDQLRTTLLEEVQIETFLAGESEIAVAIDQYYTHRLSIEGILREIETGETDQWGLQDHDYSQPANRLLFSLLSDAVKQVASDIHFEPEPGFLRIRYRKDGLLRQIRIFHISYWSAILVRIKLMAKLDIVETSQPQSGHFSLTVSGRTVDFRVSSITSAHGENVVIRILDRHQGIKTLAALELNPEQQLLLRQILHSPEGLTVFVGPGSSGKTTTLYSILGHLNTETVNIMTLENPIEHPMPMIRQFSLTPGSAFTPTIHAILKQNPDILAVGQIDSIETAQQAFQVALGGIPVFSTLNASSVFHAIQCLKELQVSSDTLSCGLNGLFGQRLIRKLCLNCRLEETIDLSGYVNLLSEKEKHNPFKLIFRANGCHECHYTGYKGQVLIAEILKITPEIASLIHHQRSMYEIAELAKEQGFVSLSQIGLEKILNGDTTIAEYVRTCGYDPFYPEGIKNP